MTTREEFEAWALDQLQADGSLKIDPWLAWQAAKVQYLEEAAKECDLMQASWERQARGGDNTGASDFRADAAEQCAMGIRALKD